MAEVSTAPWGGEPAAGCGTGPLSFSPAQSDASLPEILSQGNALFWGAPLERCPPPPGDACGSPNWFLVVAASINLWFRSMGWLKLSLGIKGENIAFWETEGEQTVFSFWAGEEFSFVFLYFSPPHFLKEQEREELNREVNGNVVAKAEDYVNTL